MDTMYAVIWHDPSEGTIEWFLIDDDWERFNLVYVNAGDDVEAESDLYDAMFGPETKNYEPVSQDTWRSEVEGSSIPVIVCGFIS